MAIKLTYFAMSGFGEPIRMILSYSKTEFEDIRVSSKEEWYKLKPTLKLPHLPMLEMDGKIYFQGMSIIRYLGRKAGLNGSNEIEDLEIDIIGDTVMDLRNALVQCYYQPDSERRNEAMKKAREVTIPFYLNILEKQAKENKGYLVGGKLTWVDILGSAFADYVSNLLHEDALANYPTLKELQEKVFKLPGIKEWVEKRPSDPDDFRVLFF